jgi:hypothetical protein
MAYADGTFYNAVYKGTAIPAAEIAAALEKAAQSIDMATRYQIRELERWPDFTQNQIKLANCAEADHQYQFGEASDMLDIAGGYTIGDVSVSGGGSRSGKGAVADHYGLSKKAMLFLLPTGLLDRRLR